VTVTSLSGLEYTGPATSGTDVFNLQAYNGVWSGWTQAEVTDQGAAPPVVTAAPTQTVAADQSIPLSDIFSVSGSGITEYQIYFGAPGQHLPALGTVTYNGTPIATDQPVTVTSLSGLEYTGPAISGTDVFNLQAYNGVWSGWVQAEVTDQGAQASSSTITSAQTETMTAGVTLEFAGANDPSISGTLLVDAANDTFAFPQSFHQDAASNFPDRTDAAQFWHAETTNAAPSPVAPHDRVDADAMTAGAAYDPAVAHNDTFVHHHHSFII
jgi:hypothetical protein